MKVVMRITGSIKMDLTDQDAFMYLNDEWSELFANFDKIEDVSFVVIHEGEEEE